MTSEYFTDDILGHGFREWEKDIRYAERATQRYCCIACCSAIIECRMMAKCCPRQMFYIARYLQLFLYQQPAVCALFSFLRRFVRFRLFH